MTSGTAAPVQAPVLKDKEKKKEIHFDEFLKKNPSKGLNTPFRFDILAQLANISTCITLYELLCLSKEMREALRDALLIQNHFWYKYPSLQKKMELHAPDVI